MDFQLHVVRGRSTSDALKLIDGVTTVGRQDECQIRIKSSQVSRRHCELFEKKGLLLVKDLSSANGTFVNGKKIQGQQVLEPGDELMIGGVTLRVAKVGVAPPVNAAPPKSPTAADTAVVRSVPVEGTDDVEFEIDFDENAVPGDDFDLMELPASPTEIAKSPSPKKEPAKEKEKEKAKAPAAPEPVTAEPDVADEAIADFLLDIKLDDEE